MTIEKTKDKRQRGDMVLVAQMLTKQLGQEISAVYASKLLNRENAKLHVCAKKAFQKVVESREKLLATVSEPK